MEALKDLKEQLDRLDQLVAYGARRDEVATSVCMAALAIIECLNSIEEERSRTGR